MCSLLSPSHRRPAHAEVGTGSRQSMVILLCCGPFYRSTTQWGCKKRCSITRGAPLIIKQKKRRKKTPPTTHKNLSTLLRDLKENNTSTTCQERQNCCADKDHFFLIKSEKKLQKKRNHFKIRFEGWNQFTSTGWNSQSTFFFSFLFLSLFVKGQIAQLEPSISY